MLPTTEEINTLRALELLYDAKVGGDQWVSIGALGSLFDGDDRATRLWLKRARERGLVKNDGSLAAWQTITADGESAVETARQRRADRSLRRATARSRVLRWVDSETPNTRVHVQTSKFFLSPYAWFEGEVLTEDDLTDAVEYLVGQGLLNGIGKASGTSYHRLTITHEGQECVTDHGADPAAFLAAKGVRQPAIQVTAAAGAAVALSLGNHSPATATSINVHLDAAVTLAKAIRQALPLLKLDDDPVEALADVEQRDDHERVKKGLRWLGGLSKDTVSGALGNVLGAAAIAILNNLS